MSPSKQGLFPDRRSERSKGWCEKKMLGARDASYKIFGLLPVEDCI